MSAFLEKNKDIFLAWVLLMVLNKGWDVKQDQI